MSGLSCAINLLVSTDMPPGEFGGPGIIELFTNRLEPVAHPYYADIAGLRVSAHFLIRRDGALIQFVPCRRRAWHAGASFWCGREHCNDFSVGIELEGGDRHPPRWCYAAHGLDPALEALSDYDIVGHPPSRGAETTPTALDWDLPRHERRTERQRRSPSDLTRRLLAANDRPRWWLPNLCAIRGFVFLLRNSF